MRKLLALLTCVFLYLWVVGTGRDDELVEKGRKWISLAQKLIEAQDWEIPDLPESQPRRPRRWD